MPTPYTQPLPWGSAPGPAGKQPEDLFLGIMPCHMERRSGVKQGRAKKTTGVQRFCRWYRICLKGGRGDPGDGLPSTDPGPGWDAYSKEVAMRTRPAARAPTPAAQDRKIPIYRTVMPVGRFLAELGGMCAVMCVGGSILSFASFQVAS